MLLQILAATKGKVSDVAIVAARHVERLGVGWITPLPQSWHQWQHKQHNDAANEQKSPLRHWYTSMEGSR
jgi:hypothetical protein